MRVRKASLGLREMLEAIESCSSIRRIQHELLEWAVEDRVVGMYEKSGHKECG